MNSYQKRKNYIKSILLPCFVLSVITGMATGLVVFAFEIVASLVTALYSSAHAAVSLRPAFLPLFLIAAAVLGIISTLFVKYLGNSKGGGIPTAIAILRGLMEFNWIRNVFVIFASAITSFLGGLPLGSEGPSVQMGTAIGRGTVRIFAKKKTAWDRYIMTGGACAGFAAATAAPLSGVFFAFEEAHRRFSPMVFLSASSAAISASATINALHEFTGHERHGLFFNAEPVLPMKFYYVALIIGIICAVAAIIFTKSYMRIGAFLREKLGTLSDYIKIPLLFVLVSLIGYFIFETTGSGLNLIELIMSRNGLPYLLIIALLIRAVMLIAANNLGITGGLFIPTLTFGAIIGSVCAEAVIALGLLPDEYYPIMIIIGIASFLAAASRTPITAVTFSIEALGGLSNILPIALAVTISYAIVEIAGVHCFTDSVIEAKVKADRADKTPLLIDTEFTVSADAFVVGKEIRDILWPPTCIITAVKKKAATSGVSFIGEGDILHLHYTTFDPEDTFAKLEDLIGRQDADVKADAEAISTDDQVPEI